LTIGPYANIELCPQYSVTGKQPFNKWRHQGRWGEFWSVT